MQHPVRRSPALVPPSQPVGAEAAGEVWGVGRGPLLDAGRVWGIGPTPGPAGPLLHLPVGIRRPGRERVFRGDASSGKTLKINVPEQQ